MISVFTFDDYRKFIRAVVSANENQWGAWAKIAKAAGCKATYLTQAMKGRAELTPDHAAGIAQFFSLSPEETEFFLLILDLNRATTKKLKEIISSKIRRLRKEQEALAKNYINESRFVIEDSALQYASCYWSTIFVLLKIPKYRSATKLSARLALPLEQTMSALEHLKKNGFVKQDKGRWTNIDESRLNQVGSLHHRIEEKNWRLRAALEVDRPFRLGLHKTSLLALSAQDAAKIKGLILDLVEKNKKVAAPSQSEDAFCFNIDFFRV